MEYSFYDFLKLLGSLALFLYGMKIMSEGLQKFAGDRLRKILTAMTTNRVTGVLTGVLITALIQSSSATTVMVVSFVNAGLLTLSQSIGVIMGANIGTTVTAWIISALGFKVDIAAFALPLLAFGIPLLFSQKSNRKSIGEFIFGFSFLFMGLSYLKNNAPDLSQNPEMLAFVQDYTDMGYISVLLFVLIGTVLTMIVQASAATMAITLIMCANGWISFELGAALVLGENIGTTITANLAALTGNTQARRAALAHLVFNVFGVIWVLCLFVPFTQGVSWFVENIMGTKDPAVAVSFKLSAFHTCFNICNVLILIWFVKFIERTVCAIIPQKEQDEEYRLRPNERMRLDKTSARLSIRPVDVKPYIAWHEGRFIFDNESLGDIMETLSHWYGVDVVFDEPTLRYLHFTGNMSRYDSLTPLLRSICQTVGLRIVIKNRTIYIYQ